MLRRRHQHSLSSPARFYRGGVDISATAFEIARRKASQTKVDIDFLRGSFVNLSFSVGAFDFVFDMGCFHHVEIADRRQFIADVYRVLKAEDQYMLTCFSYRNGPRWNHFSRQQIIDLFSGFFTLQSLQHAPSLEGDGVIRFFYTALMRRREIAR